MNLLTNFNEFAEEIQWICWPNSLKLHSHQRHSASSRTSFNVIENVIQHGFKRHVVEQNKLICRGKQIDLLRKTNWFAEENKLICWGKYVEKCWNVHYISTLCLLCSSGNKGLLSYCGLLSFAKERHFVLPIQVGIARHHIAFDDKRRRRLLIASVEHIGAGVGQWRQKLGVMKLMTAIFLLSNCHAAIA